MKETRMCQLLYDASIQAGVVALAMQQDIVNEGKQIEKLEGEQQRHYDMREAKTKVDVMVQDMLLTALREYRLELTLDAEEESRFLSAYPNSEAPYSFVIDPIDGTLEYIQQKDSYSICSAIILHHEIVAAVVYFPAVDIAYTYDPTYQARRFHPASYLGFTQGEALCATCEQVPNIVYKNDRVQSAWLTRFEEAGLQIIDDATCNCPQALIKCLEKKALCYVSDTRNIRDILMGAILSKTLEGAAFDEEGSPLTWPAKGRLPFGIFTMFPEEIKKYKN